MATRTRRKDVSDEHAQSNDAERSASAEMRCPSLVSVSFLQKWSKLAIRETKWLFLARTLPYLDKSACAWEERRDTIEMWTSLRSW